MKIFKDLFEITPNGAVKFYEKQLKWCYKKRNSKIVKALANAKEWKLIQLGAKMYEEKYLTNAK